VQMPQVHIKSIGSHPLVVRLHPEVQATVSLEVVAEQ
jgi:large subunit ribosomal protein L9